MIRWGILGCGRIASSAFAPAITWSKNGVLQAAASRDRARAEQKARELGARASAGTYDELLARDDVDAVYLGLPNGEHARWAIAAAQAGKHVLCDKSLALRVEDALAMREAFRARGLLLVEAFMYRHHPQWTLARSLLAAGAVGDVRSVRVVFGGPLDAPDDHRWSTTLGGGALFDVTCYGIDVARLIVGEEPVVAKASAEWAETGVDRATHALLEFPGGAVATVHGSLRSVFEQSVVVVGTSGRMVLERPFVPHFDPTEILVEHQDGRREVHGAPGANHFLYLVEHVAGCIEAGEVGAEAVFPAEDGVENVKACVKIASSLRPLGTS